MEKYFFEEIVRRIIRGKARTEEKKKRQVNQFLLTRETIGFGLGLSHLPSIQGFPWLVRASILNPQHV